MRTLAYEDVPLLALTLSVLLAWGCLQGPPGGLPTPAPGAPSATPSATSSPSREPLPAKTGLVFTAVEFGAGDDVVARIRNLGSASVDLETGKYQLCGGEFVYGKLSKTRTSIAAGAEVRVHVNTVAGCTESGTEFCAKVGTGVTSAVGNLALYRDTAGSGFEKPERIVDFVSWGTTARENVPREDVAAEAGLWREQEFVDVSASPASISVAVPGASGAESWK